MDYYGKIAPSYNSMHKSEQLRKLEIIKHHLNVKKGDLLLDVGCGTGLSLDIFPSYNIGIEPSPEMARQSSVPVIIGKAESLPFCDNAFDHVICVTALHNFSDPEKGVEEMLRVGKGSYAISLLKKAKEFIGHKKLIETRFKVRKIIDDFQDEIYII